MLVWYVYFDFQVYVVLVARVQPLAGKQISPCPELKSPPVVDQVGTQTFRCTDESLRQRFLSGPRHWFDVGILSGNTCFKKAPTSYRSQKDFELPWGASVLYVFSLPNPTFLDSRTPAAENALQSVSWPTERLSSCSGYTHRRCHNSPSLQTLNIVQDPGPVWLGSDIRCDRKCKFSVLTYLLQLLIKAGLPDHSGRLHVQSDDIWIRNAGCSHKSNRGRRPKSHVCQSLLILRCNSGFKLTCGQWFWLSQPVYILASGFNKLSFVALYHRVFYPEKRIRCACLLLGFICVGWTITYVCLSFFACTPIPRVYDRTIAGTCIDAFSQR